MCKCQILYSSMGSVRYNIGRCVHQSCKTTVLFQNIEASLRVDVLGMLDLRFHVQNWLTCSVYPSYTIFFNEAEVSRKKGMEEGEKEEGIVGEPNPNPKPVTTKVPEVEIRLFRLGKGPIDVFRTPLGGWDRDQIEVRDILDKYHFKSVFAFNPASGRGVPIRFNPKNGRSIPSYSAESVVWLDGEPTDSLLSPVTKILTGVAMVTILIALVVKDETPEWLRKSKFYPTNEFFSPWILACVVIAFMRIRKRTKDFLTRKFGR